MSWLAADFSFLLYLPTEFRDDPAFRDAVETWLTSFVEQLGTTQPVHRKIDELSPPLRKISAKASRATSGDIVQMVTNVPTELDEAEGYWIWGLPGFPHNRRSWKFLSEQLMILTQYPVFEDVSWDGKLQFLDKENIIQLMTFSITLDVDQNWIREIYMSQRRLVGDEEVLEEKRLRAFISSEDIEPV